MPLKSDRCPIVLTSAFLFPLFHTLQSNLHLPSSFTLAGTLNARRPCCLFPFSTCFSPHLFLAISFHFCLFSSSSFFCLFSVPHNKPPSLVIYLPNWPLLLPQTWQSLCEFYVCHCTRIEALRRQLDANHRGRQVEHTAAVGRVRYCIWGNNNFKKRERKSHFDLTSLRNRFKNVHLD